MDSAGSRGRCSSPDRGGATAEEDPNKRLLQLYGPRVWGVRGQMEGWKVLSQSSMCKVPPSSPPGPSAVAPEDDLGPRPQIERSGNEDSERGMQVCGRTQETWGPGSLEATP